MTRGFYKRFILFSIPQKGNGPLHIACLAGQTKVVQILVDNGANVNLKAQVDLKLLSCVVLCCVMLLYCVVLCCVVL